MVWGPPPRAGSFQNADGTTLRVTGFGPDIRNTDLQAEFGEFGHVLRIHVLQGKGAAFVEYSEKEDANATMKDLDGKHLLGATISVSFAPPPPERKPKDAPQRDVITSQRMARELMEDVHNKRGSPARSSAHGNRRDGAHITG